MVFIALYPAIALLAMFIVLVIMILLRHGPKICKVRHHTLPDEKEWEEKTFDHAVSYA